MAEDDALDTFMQGISLAESGSTTGNYTARNPSGAYGRYQIMPQNWDSWATQSGIGGASIQDPAAQDRVARFMMNGYYQDYGSWDMVATAWRLGPAVANRVRAEGWGALTATERAKIDPYLSKVMPFTGQQAYTGAGTSAPNDLTGDPPQKPGDILRQMFNGMSQKVAGGDRVSANDLLGTTASTAASLQGAGASGGATGLPSSEGSEGTEEFDFGNPGSSWNSSSTATHTYATNEERLNDPMYRNIAENVVAPIGQYLTETFGVSVGQHRDLGSRPAGGAQFSDHYWGGALDVTGSQEQMQQVADWARQHGEQLGVNYTLWQVENHYDHVHISWLPPASQGAVHDPSTALLQSGIVKPQQVMVPMNVIPSTGVAQPQVVIPQRTGTVGGAGYG